MCALSEEEDHIELVDQTGLGYCEGVGSWGWMKQQQQQLVAGNQSNARQTLAHAGRMPPERKDGKEKRLLVYLPMWAIPATYTSKGAELVE